MILSLFYGKWLRSYVSKKSEYSLVYLLRFYGTLRFATRAAWVFELKYRTEYFIKPQQDMYI